MLMSSNSDGIYVCPPGTEEEVFCGICGALMRAKRDQHGPTSYAMSMANMKRDYDYFECPLRMSHWHQKVVKIREFMKSVPSDVLCRLMREECDEILEEQWKSKKGLIGAEMWLLPRMHDQARETQEVWLDQQAMLDGNTSGISTERPG